MATIPSADVKITVNDDGSLNKVGKNAEKTSKSVNKLNKSEQTLNRNYKGASQQSSNQTKNFSKMAQGITGGLVPAYATLAANIFAIGAAFRFLQNAADLRILEQGQAEYATRTGQSLSILTRQLQAATEGQLAFSEAAQSVAIGTAAGLSAKQINQLGIVAKNASLMLGRDLTDSFNRLVRGAVKAEPELLDELGIILRLETAAENYAQKLNLNAKQLNIFQKSQSVVNEVLAQGLEKFGGVETEANSLTKLAKSFDDLLNSIKRTIGPLSEFLAMTLTQNPAATAAIGGTLVSGVLRAVTPQSQMATNASATAQAEAKLQSMYSGKRDISNLTSTDIKRMEKEMERAYDRAAKGKQKSVYNTEKITRQEARRTLQVIKTLKLQEEAENAGFFTKYIIRIKATYAEYRIEHGKTMAFIKTSQQVVLQGFNRLLSFVSYAGIIISVVALAKQLFSDSESAEAKYKEAQAAFGELFSRNAKDLENTISKLKTHDALMTNMLQTARALNNIDFSNVMLGLEGGPAVSGFMGRAMADPMSLLAPAGTTINTSEGKKLGVQDNIRLSKDQKAGLEGIVRILRAEQQVLLESGTAYKEHDSIIEKINNTLHDNKEGVLGSTNSFNAMSDELKRISKEGTIAAKTMDNLGQATQILNSSTSDFSKALRSFRTPQTSLTRLTTNIRQAGDALAGVGKAYSTGQVEARFNADTGTIFDGATQEMLNTFIGDDHPIRKQMEEAHKKMSSISQNISGGPVDFTEDQINKMKETRSKTAGSIVKAVGEVVQAEAERLHQKEMQMIRDKTKVQTNLVTLGIGATKGQTKQLQLQGKIVQNNLDVANQRILIEELEAKGLEKDDAQIEMETQKLNLMQAQGLALDHQIDKAHQLEMAMKNSFESGIAGSIDDLITGKNSSLSEAMMNLAKGVFESFSKTISDQMATGISNFLFGNKELEGYQKGAEIIREAHIQGINAGMGNSMGDIGMGSDTAETGSKFGRVIKQIGSFFGFSGAKGGITPVYAASGGVFSGSKTGYPAVMHGNEAVVPLPDGKSIPISGNLGGTVNVSVNMTTGESSSTSDASDMIAMGESIAQAVQNELEKQQRPGGQLSPY